MTEETGERRMTDGWVGPVQSDGLTELLIREDYPLPPVYITENDTAFCDYVDPEGAVDDEERVSSGRRVTRRGSLPTTSTTSPSGESPRRAPAGTPTWPRTTE
jgi:hypothetical protein